MTPSKNFPPGRYSDLTVAGHITKNSIWLLVDYRERALTEFGYNYTVLRIVGMSEPRNWT